jgi:hypothetical protein
LGGTGTEKAGNEWKVDRVMEASSCKAVDEGKDEDLQISIL